MSLLFVRWRAEFIRLANQSRFQALCRFIKCIWPRHVDGNMAEDRSVKIKEVAIGLAGEASVSLGIFNLELDRYAVARRVRNKAEIVMTNRSMI